MSVLTILEVVNNLVIPKIGLAAQSAIYSSAPTREQSELRLTIRDAIRGIMLDVQGHEWEELQTEGELTGDGTTVLFDRPADFGRYMKPAAIFSSKLQRYMYKVTSANQWLAMKERNIGLTVGAWREQGGQIEFYPAPAAGEVLTFMYISNYADTLKSMPVTLTADTQKFRLDDDLLAMAIVWKWREQKGLPYAERLQDYNDYYSQLVGDDGGSHIITDRPDATFSSKAGTYHGGTIVDTR